MEAQKLNESITQKKQEEDTYKESHSEVINKTNIKEEQELTDYQNNPIESEAEIYGESYSSSFILALPSFLLIFIATYKILQA